MADKPDILKRLRRPPTPPAPEPSPAEAPAEPDRAGLVELPAEPPAEEPPAKKKGKKAGKKLYRVGLHDQPPHDPIEAADEAEAIAKFNSDFGILSTDHVHRVELLGE